MPCWELFEAQSEAYRAKVKTPFELVTSAARAMGAAIDTTPRTAQLIARLGQPSFGHQAPAGESSLLLERFQDQHFLLRAHPLHAPDASITRRLLEILEIMLDPLDPQAYTYTVPVPIVGRAWKRRSSLSTVLIRSARS